MLFLRLQWLLILVGTLVLIPSTSIINIINRVKSFKKHSPSLGNHVYSLLNHLHFQRLFLQPHIFSCLLPYYTSGFIGLNLCFVFISSHFISDHFHYIYSNSFTCWWCPDIYLLSIKYPKFLNTHIQMIYPLSQLNILATASVVSDSVSPHRW